MRRKKQVNKFPTAFRKMALERLKNCRNVTELSAELGIHRTQLYKWRDQMEPIEDGPGPAANSRERELRKEIRDLKRLLADKTLEVDFFKGALQKSRLDGGAAAALARRRLRPNPGVDADARHPEYRADVSLGPGESGGLL
jgi:transposase-like protein